MIVVTAPTSRIGRALLPLLLDKHAAVRAIARDPSKLSDDIRSRVEVIEGSHGDAVTLDRALLGATHLFWLCPANPQATSVEEAYVGFTKPAAKAIGDHGIARVVSITALGRGTVLESEAGLVTGSLAMDDLLAATGAHLRALAMPSFMDNLLWQMPVLREKGLFFTPLPRDLALPACSVSDIASKAARFLLDDTWAGQEEIPVLGPENISADRMAEIMGEVLDRKIVCSPLSFETYEAMFVKQGYSAAMAAGMADMMRAKANSLDLGVARTHDTASPTSFRQWCETVLQPVFGS
ncbi:NAD(P)H-binding protein [Sphingobium phenoxybenzoativorans]|uniref:NAD(P)H-binding protein n=1 Tax=Sphingobium phenoxybenzoativorans TaxID=1592790 RepID=UPI000871C9C7|nr:NAD(P)H-binding protein [Sphingobium phenoxybenzoativorans]